MTPHVDADGSVWFSSDGKAAGLHVAPVSVLDSSGTDVTPADASWQLRRSAGSWWLVLRLNDAKLRLPYTIDPSISAVSVTASSLAAGAYANWTANFTTSSTGALAAGGTITVTFPTWTGGTIPANPSVVLLGPSGFSTSCTATAATATATVTITLANASGQTCALGNSAATSVKLLGIINTTSTGSKTISVKTSKDTTAVNATATIAAAAAPTAVSFAGAPQTGAALSSWTLGFTSTATGALVGGSTITAVFNSSFAVPAAPAVTLGSQFASCSATASATAQTVTVTLTNSGVPGSCLLPASTATTVRLAGLTNPAAGSYPNTGFTLKTRSNTISASPSAAVVIAAATSVSGVSFAGSPQTGGARASWTVGFTSSNTTGAALGVGAKITTVFPAGFAIPATPTVTLPSGFSSCAATGSTSSQTVTVTLANSGGTCSLPINTAASLRVAGITNPVAGSYVKTGFTVKTSTDTVVASPAANVVIAAATSPTSVSIGYSTRSAGATALVTPSFTSSASGALAAGDTITVRLPSGTTVPASPTITLTGGFASCSATGSGASNVATVTLSGASCALPTLTSATLTVAGVTNPPAGTYANTTLSVATSTDTLAANPSSGVVIFGPATQLAFTTQPASSVDNAAFPTQPVVTVQDAGGRTVANDSSQVTLSITSGTGSPGATLSCTTNPISATSGVASFAGCQIAKTGTGYTLRASDGSLTQATSASFNITPGPATQLTVSGSSSQAAGAANGLTITALDAMGNTATGYAGDHGLTFTGASLAPDGTHPTVADKAGTPVNVGSSTTITFTGGASSAGGQMKLYKAENAMITVTDGSIGNSGLDVAVNAGSAASLALAATTTNPNAGAADQLTITARDSYGNTAMGYAGDHALTFSGASVAADGTHPTATDKSGTAVNFGTATPVTFTGGISSAGGQMRLYVPETAAISVSDGSVSSSALNVTVTAVPPQNTTPPVISGTAVEGQMLSVGDGAWSGNPASYSYQWRRCDSAGLNCSDIGAATAVSYTLVATDVGNTIRAAVTAINAGGSTTAASAASSVIDAAQSSYRPAVLLDNPVGYWRLAESSGSAIADGLGGGHDGTYTGAVTLGETSPITADGTDHAVFFNGGWGSIPYYSGLNPTSDKLTMEFWWKGAAPGSAQFALLKGYTSHNDPYYQYGVGGDSSGGVRVVVDTSGSFNPWDSGIAWPGGGTWHQVVVTYDGSLGSGNLKLYVDSVLRAQANRTGNVRSYATPLGFMDILNLGAGYQTSGRLDDVAIYSIALSSSRIGAHYAAATQPTPQPPANMTPPVLSGTPVEGETLSTDDGAWTGAPAGFAYQWRRCDTAGANCTDIAGATSSSRIATSADVGSTLRVVVTATNGVGSTSTASAPTGTVADRLPHNVSGAPPQATGFTSAGDTLLAANGSWTGSPTSFSYQWRRCDGSGGNCADVPAATGRRYLLAADDLGYTFKVNVVAHNDAGTGQVDSLSAAAVTTGAPAGAWAPSPSAGTIFGDPYYTGYHWRWRPAGWSPALPDGGWVFELEGGNGQDNDRFYHCLWIGNPLYSNTCDNADMRDHAFKLVREYGGGLVETSHDACSPFPQYPMACFHSMKQPNGLLPGEDWGLCAGKGKHRVCVSKPISDPVNAASGDYVSSATDLRMRGEGVPFELTRTYNSADHEGGPLGWGWSWSLGPHVSNFETLQTIVHTEDGARLGYDMRSLITSAPGVRSVLTRDGSALVLTRPDQVKYVFGALGRVETIKDRNGLGLTFSYEGQQLTGVTDSAGRTVSISYDTSGRVASVTLPDGRSVTYGYTSALLTSVVDARGKTTTYTYDDDGNLLTETDPNGHVIVTNTFDDAGRIRSMKDGLNYVTSFSWNPSTETETTTDARGQDWQDIYSGGVLVERIDPLGNTTHYGHDAALNLTSETDGRGNTTTMTYDDRGNMLTRTAPPPLGYSETHTYNTLNDITSFTDGRDHETTYTYDAYGDLASKTAAETLTTTYGHNAANGRLTSITTPRGKTTSFGYDIAGNLASVTSPLGEVTTFGYDTSGRLTSRVDPRGHTSGTDPSDYTTTLAYNANDQVVSKTNPLGDSATTSYDDAGNAISSTDENDRTTTYAYDAADQLTSVSPPTTPPLNGTTTYGHDAIGNLTTRTDPNSNITTYAYDAANRLASEVSPLGQKWTYTHDASGNIAARVDPAGNEEGAPAGSGTTMYGYDVLNRPTSVGYSDSTPDVSFSYDANGNRTAMNDGAGSETYSFDTLDRLTEVTRGLDLFNYDYNADGAVTERSYPDGTQIDYSYDDDGRISTVLSAGATTNYAYDVAGNPVTTTLPTTNGYVESRSYDRVGRLTDIQTVKGASTLAHFSYTLDAVGNPVSVSGTDTVTYQYDTRDRLVEACYQVACPGSSDPFIRYSYDGVGNRVDETRPAGATTYAYNSADQLVSTDGPGGTVNYGYDPSGNQVQAGSRTFTYDQANRLTSATVGGTETSYSYDGVGNRLTSENSSTATAYMWDENNPLPQLAVERDASSGTSMRSYVYGNDLLALRSGGASFYFQHDAIGSVTNLTSASGGLQRHYLYDPFGNMRVSGQDDPAAPVNVIGFADQLNDPASGTQYMRARAYDSSSGRFLSLDPLLRQPSAPTESSYSYADNRPTVLIDPSGMGPVWNRDCGTGFWCWATSPGGKRAIGCGLAAGGAAATAFVIVPVDFAALVGGGFWVLVEGGLRPEYWASGALAAGAWLANGMPCNGILY